MSWGKPSAPGLPSGALPFQRLRRLLHFEGRLLDQSGPFYRLISHECNQEQLVVLHDRFLCPEEVLTLQILLFPGVQLCCQAVVSESQHQGSGCRAVLNLVMSSEQRQNWVRYLDQVT